MSGINTFLIDANRLSREGLLAILARDELNVVREASTLDELPARQADEPEPALILIDCGTDPARARQDLADLRNCYPSAKIVVLSGTDDPTFMVACFGASVDGLVSKNVSSAALLKSLHLIIAGERVFPSQMVSMLLSGNAHLPTSTPKLQPGAPSLSERETQILQCLVAGDSNKAIANNLHVTEATVKVHLKSILRKIQVRNRTQAAIWALNNGMRAGELAGEQDAGSKPYGA
jgi:two-component system nitrate/nitrite response regulator NarL